METILYMASTAANRTHDVHTSEQELHKMLVEYSDKGGVNKSRETKNYPRQTVQISFLQDLPLHSIANQPF